MEGHTASTTSIHWNGAEARSIVACDLISLHIRRYSVPESGNQGEYSAKVECFRVEGSGRVEFIGSGSDTSQPAPAHAVRDRGRAAFPQT